MYAVIIDGSLINPTVDVIEVSQEFLDKDLGESMFDEGIVDSNKNGLMLRMKRNVSIFSFQYCGYSPNCCQWQWFDEKPEIKRLTPKSFR